MRLKLSVLLVTLGLLLLVLTIIGGWFIIPNLIKQKIVDAVQLSNGSDTFKKWANISTPIFSKFYIFNVTNPDEVRVGKKPILDELGPYVYEQKRSKFDIKFNERKDTVKYRQLVSYFFRPDLSEGSEDDILFALNIPLVGISKRLAQFPGMVSFVANMYFTRFDQTLFLKTTIEKFLFTGIYNPFVDELQNSFELKILPNGTFGFYYGKNNTDDGSYEIRSGKRDYKEFGKIVKWNDQSELYWWGGKYCNMINGSDGSLFPPFLEKDAILEIFTPDLCRSLYLSYNSKVDFFGIPAYKFTIPQRMLEDPRNNHDNMCFCPNPGRKMEGCLRAGAIQLAACRKGAPIVASTPHFLGGYEGYLDQSIGLNPLQSDHETYMELEPNSGVVLRVHKRIQINVALEPISTLDVFARVPDMIFPVLWVDEHAAMPVESIELLKSKLVKKIQLIEVGRVVLVSFSLVISISGGIVYFIQIRRKREMK